MKADPGTAGLYDYIGRSVERSVDASENHRAKLRSYVQRMIHAAIMATAVDSGVEFFLKVGNGRYRIDQRRMFRIVRAIKDRMGTNAATMKMTDAEFKTSLRWMAWIAKWSFRDKRVVFSLDQFTEIKRIAGAA